MDKEKILIKNTIPRKGFLLLLLNMKENISV